MAGGSRPVVGLRPTYTGGRTVYDGQHAVTGERQTYTGRTVVGLAPSSQKKGGGGLLHALTHNVVTHTLSKTGSDLVSAAEHAPGGIYTITKDTGKTIVDTSPWASKQKRDSGGPLARDAKATVAQTAADFKHPLRHPGNTLLDTLGLTGAVGGTAARGAAAASELAGEGSATARVGRAATAAARKPNPAPRLVSHDGLTVKLPASPNPITRAAQHGFDRLRESFPNVPVLGAAHVVGKENVRNIRYASDIAKAPVNALVAKAKQAGLLKQKVPGKYTASALVKQHVLRVAAEEVPVPDRVAFHEGQLAKGHKATAQTDAQIAAMRERDFTHGHQLQVKLNQGANEYLTHERLPLSDFLHGKIRDLAARGVERPQLEVLAKRAHVARANGETITVPRIKDPQLAEVFGQMLKVAGSREGVLQELDKLGSGQIVNRLSAPGRVLLGAEYKPATAARTGRPTQTILKARSRVAQLEQLHETARNKAIDRASTEDLIHYADPAEQSPIVARLSSALSVAKDELQQLEDAAAKRVGPTGIVGHENFVGGAARVPTIPALKASRSSKLPPPVGSGAGVADVKDLPSITHPYTGAAYRAGHIRTDVVRLMAESGLEAQRYWTLLHVADELRHVAKPVPTSKFDIPVRLERLPGQESLATVVRRIEEQGHVPEGLLAHLSHAYDGVRQTIFPDYNPGTRLPVDEVPGVGFVDERLLGGLNKPSPLAGAIQHGWIRGSVKVIDTLNNASKLAILYLKPAYLAPNLLGNVSLNFVQQGFAAPHNLYRAAKLNAEMGTDTVALVDAAMGEGVAASLDHYSGRFVSAAAQKWSRIVDVVPRRASFLYEARRAGYKTPEQVSKLLTDHDLADTLNQVQRRANASIIDYGQLGPIEKTIVRRVLFFYPWLRGSSVWSVHFLADHPVQAGVVGQLGQIGKEQQSAVLGDQLPSWAEGLIPVGTGPNGLPETINPAGTSVLSTPAEVLQMIQGLATGVNPDNSLASNLTPALTFAQTAVTKGVGPATQGLYENLPPVLLAQRAHGGRPSKTFPSQNNADTALLQFLISTGLVPRETDPNELRAGYFAQQQRR